MRFIATLLVIVIGIIYWPLNIFFMWCQKFYFKMRNEDRVIYWVITPFYFILVGIVTIISYPYEKVSEFAGH